MNQSASHSHHVPKESWWKRNWKWFVPTGCLSMIVLFVLGIIFFVTTFMKKSTPYIVAYETATTNSYVIEALGAPIEQEGMVQGNISIENSSGEAEMYIPIEGSRKSGMLYVVATKDDGEWSFSVMKVSVESSNTVIDLLEE